MQSGSSAEAMLTITGEYALRAVVFLAQHAGEPKTCVEIAGATKVCQGYLSKILQQLVKSGIIDSRRGIHGGFVIARPARGISVLDVLKAVGSGPRRIKRCPLGIPGHGELCHMHRMIDESMAAVEAAFAAADLETMSSSAGGKKPLCDDPQPTSPKDSTEFPTR